MCVSIHGNVGVRMSECVLGSVKECTCVPAS